MERAIVPEKGGLGAQHLEIVLDETARGVQSHYVPVTDEEKALNKRVNRRLDCFVLSLLALGFIFCGIDKTNIGFVATSSFPKDANLGPDAIPHSLSLFSATYVVLQPVMVVLARRVGVKYFLTVQLILWGGLCMCHAVIRNSGTLIALRLLIGAAEAGFTQIGNYYMSTAYPKAELGKSAVDHWFINADVLTPIPNPTAWRVGLFSGMYSIAGAFSGLVAYGLLKLETPHIHGWQAVFLLEGGFTVLLGLLTLLVLPRRLVTAWFLTGPERAHALYRMEVDLAGTQEADAPSTMVTRRDVLDVITDGKKLGTVLCNVTSVLPVTAFTTFLPLVVKGMGYSGNDATLMSAPPFIAGSGVIGLLLIVRSSDHFRERSLHTVFGMLLGIVGCIVMAVSDQNALRYGFSYVCMTGVFILRLSHADEVPLIITICIMVAGCCGLISIRFMYQRENRKRAAEIATWDERRFAEERASQVRRGDQRHTFMYGL
ncbi:MFS general substrate transporter [Apiospora aurea]|uniref:MFS general substrate transporter n=1 Tax=Apiospora aurea TaxID=335848 RepID=A0ABR1QG44_9PEZI